MALLLAATTSFAGIIENIVFRDNNFAKRLHATARVMTTIEAINEIARFTIAAKTNALTNTSTIIYLTIQNTNNVTVWGSGRIRGGVINEPFSFATGRTRCIA